MSLKSFRIPALTLSLTLFATLGSQAVTLHHRAGTTLSQPSNDGNGPGGGDPNPMCPNPNECAR